MGTYDKIEENGIVTRNKARLVAKQYNKGEWIDFEEICAHLARLKAIKILLAFAYVKNFTLSNKCKKYIPKWLYKRGVFL